MSLLDWIICGTVVIGIIAAVISVKKTKKCGGCCGSCAACARNCAMRCNQAADESKLQDR